ncbi:MAG: ABC transporter ATP-binding protein [Gammaproteobacteria bacterium]|nr:ABC transporter ATP-binding protein [Gammaproteobacteria bacterium]MYD80255.1 ABC transporter ATP-binding protein [Gammaproteobacteria bacterium]
MTDAVVQLKDVTRVYGQGNVAVHALQEVTVEIYRGEFVCVVGPSGCGKSTMLHLIGGLDSPTSGTVTLEDQDLSTYSNNELSDLRLKRMGFVFQAFNLIPVLSASENVEFILQLQGVEPKDRKARALEVLDSVGLADAANRRPGELSGGQQQRVAVARALVGSPLLLIADEPSANLDSTTTRELCELLQTINREHRTTILIATHDSVVMSYSTRTIQLEDGKIRQADAA